MKIEKCYFRLLRSRGAYLIKQFTCPWVSGALTIRSVFRNQTEPVSVRRVEATCWTCDILFFLNNYK